MLVGWVINNSSSDVAKGNNPGIYSGIKGQISDLEGNCYFLKINVIQIWKPKHCNVFVIRPKVLNTELDIVEAKGGKHVLHAIFVESNNGINYKGINSWGTNW